MKLIIGLGNPGSKYDGTKHNIGFSVVDRLMERQGLSKVGEKFRADYTEWRVDGEKVYLIKPYTYMNLSGEAVLPFMTYFGIGMDDIIVVYDDLDLDVGKIRLRRNGSAGGHNGVKSLIELLGSKDFERIKVGIGRPQNGWKVVDHVLAPFNPADKELVEQAIDKAADALEDWASGKTFIQLMNQYN